MFVTCLKKNENCSAFKNYIKKHGIEIKNVEKRKAFFIKKQEKAINICFKCVLNMFKTSY